jgi:hypothetical protein
MTWRLWRYLRGRYDPPEPPRDLAEARSKRLEAEYELRHTRGRSGVVNDTVAAFSEAADVDEFAELIEEAFARKGRR